MKSIFSVLRLAGACFIAATVSAQTAVNLRTQSKSVDFSNSVYTKTWKTGTSLPATCAIGESYFKVDTSAGKNLYGCIAPNTWVLQAGGGGVSSVFGRIDDVTAQEGDYSLTQLADVSAKQGNGVSVQMFGSGSPAANDCAKFDANGNIVSAGGACAGGGILAGNGVTVSAGAGSATVAVDSAFVPAMLTTAAMLDFPSIALSSCSEQAVTLTGAATGNAVAQGWPSQMEAGLIGTMWVSAANTVTVRLCNMTAASIDPADASFRLTIVRSL